MLVMRYLECGWLYLRLRKFISTYNNNPSVGLILQAFCAYISAELKEYHRLLAVLESQLGNKDEGADCGSLTLRRLMVWLDQPLERLRYLSIVCDAVREKKGGVLLSTIHAYSIHGDQFKSSLLRGGLAKCAIPIRDMIFEWICDGQIRDIHEEVNTIKDWLISEFQISGESKLKTLKLFKFLEEVKLNNCCLFIFKIFKITFSPLHDCSRKNFLEVPKLSIINSYPTTHCKKTFSISI